MKFILKKIVILMVIGGCFASTGCKNSTAEDSIVEESDNSLSGKDIEYLARYIYVSDAGEHVRIENQPEAEYGYNLWVSPTTGKYYTYPHDDESYYVTFKTEDEEQNQAYFYVTAETGYYIDITYERSIALPHNIDPNKFELNPETNYWRYK